MRKIKRLHHLQKEQQRLHDQRISLEHTLRTDWQDLRRSISPGALARHALGSGIDWMRKKWFTKN